MFNRLYSYLKENNLLTEHNSGFKPMDSTINRLIHLTHKIYNGLDDKKEILIVFLDISKAFDRVWHPGLLHKLTEFGISGLVHDWLSDYLTNRYQKVVIGGEESSSKIINAGVPQGSILGPLLFLVFINDIINDLENDIFLFADDASLMKIFNDINVASTSINRDLQRLSQWSETWRVCFNLIKTVFMIISKKNSHHTPNIIMNNTALTQVYEECYLGLTLHPNMSWKPHLNKIICKSSRKIGLLTKMKNKLPRSALSKYYVSFVRPVLEYGSVVFDNCTAHESHSLEQVQRRAALLCTGAFKRSSYKKLLDELGWESLEDRRKKAKLILMFKIINNLTPNYLKELIPPQVLDATNYNLRNRQHIRLPASRTQYMQTSYIPSTLKQWNALDPEIRSIRTVSTLKAHFKFRPNPMSKLYSVSYEYSFRFLTQIRLGLSKLKNHLFTHGILLDPICPNCQNHELETPAHYFLHCPAYAAHRGEMSRGLRDLLAPESISNNPALLNTIIFGCTDASFEINIELFKTVCNFIKNTKRFTEN
jgi:hypothetical protein